MSPVALCQLLVSWEAISEGVSEVLSCLISFSISFIELSVKSLYSLLADGVKDTFEIGFILSVLVDCLADGKQLGLIH